MRRYAEWLRTDLGRPVRWRDWPLLVRLIVLDNLALVAAGLGALYIVYALGIVPL